MQRKLCIGVNRAVQTQLDVHLHVIRFHLRRFTGVLLLPINLCFNVTLLLRSAYYD